MDPRELQTIGQRIDAAVHQLDGPLNRLHRIRLTLERLAAALEKEGDTKNADKLEEAAHRVEHTVDTITRAALGLAFAQEGAAHVIADLSGAPDQGAREPG